MKIALFLLSAVVSAVSLRADILAFERKQSVYVCDEKGDGLRRVARGVNPQISSDGTRVVFNTQLDATTDRLISTVDLASGALHVFDQVPSRNSFGPVWSPDGRRVAFQILSDRHWGIGITAADGSEFQFLKLPPGVDDAWEPAWSADGKALFCHDLDAIYLISLEGKLLEKWPLASISPRISMSSGSRISVSADGQFLFMDLDLDEGVVIPEWEGPPPSIWKLDLDSGRSTRVSPDGIYAWGVQAAPDGGILCLGLVNAGDPTNVYWLSADGSSRRLVMKNASSPSLAAGVRLPKKK